MEAKASSKNKERRKTGEEERGKANKYRQEQNNVLGVEQ